MTVIPLILSGGAGTRLWPLSREQYPKQLLPLIHPTTMLQDTVLRGAAVAGAQAPIVVCNQEHRFMVAEQLREVGVAAASIILEPVGRNTAPAVAVGALEAQRLCGPAAQPVLLVLPADHVVRDLSAFLQVANAAIGAAREGALVTFGIVPDRAETGYGYLYAGAAAGTHGARQVEQFVEKPDAITAADYLADGNYLWNSGMFLLRADVYLEELGRLQPAMLQSARAALQGAQRDLDFNRLDVDAFSLCPSDSIDYAVMERSDRVVVFPLDAGWSDVGSWRSVWAEGTADASGNVVSGDVVLDATHDCYVRSDSRLVATIGVRDLIIVDTKDALLVADKAQVHNVRNVVAQLKAAQRSEADTHRKVYRPWGAYEGIDQGERFQVKRITVKPGERLSLQKHHHRAEHWIVVQGTARVTRNEEVFLVTENESTYIPLGAVHRLENPGLVELQIIEVQSGSYLGEDDIVRLDDNYGRHG